MRLSKTSMKFSVLVALFSLSFFGYSSAADAAKITEVKGKQVRIDADGSDVKLKQGEKYFVIVDGKKKAIVQVTKISGSKALGQVIKGTATVNGQLASPDGASSGASSATGSKRARRGTGTPNLLVGGLIGYSLDSQTVKDSTNNITIATNGSGFSGKAFGDMVISGGIGLIGRFGIETFNTTGTAGVRTVKTNIMYATADLLLRYQFLTGTVAPFASAGLGLHFPLSKTSDVLIVPKISSTTIFFFGGGMNFAMTNDLFLTATAEYGYFPPTNDVTTSIIAIRGGLGWRL